MCQFRLRVTGSRECGRTVTLLDLRSASENEFRSWFVSQKCCMSFFFKLKNLKVKSYLPVLGNIMLVAFSSIIL